MGPPFFPYTNKQNMMKLKSLLLLIIPLVIFLLSLPTFSNANNVAFVKCLSKNKIPFYTNKDNPNYTTILKSTIRNLRYSLPTTLKPTTILTPTTPSQVSSSIVCAKKSKTLVITRSGGHDYEGLSYVADSEFVILDMLNFRNITIDVPSKSAWVDSGAQLGDLYYQISRKTQTLAFPAGVCPTVGVGGHISGAGYGNMIRMFGLTVDNLLDARIVVANGAILDRKSMGEDLFWAIRGGGGASFGVILSYKINLVTVPEKVTVFNVYRFMYEDAAGILEQYQEIMPTIDRRLFVRVLLQPRSMANKTKTLRTTFIGMFLGDAKSLLEITGSVFPKLKLKATECQEMTWIQSVLNWTNADYLASPEMLLNRTSKVDFGKRKSDYVRNKISAFNLTRIFRKMIEIQDVGLVFNSYGGRMNEISEDETPFPHRCGNILKIQYSLSWKNESETQVNLDGATKLFEFMEPFVSTNPRRAYLNYRDLDIGTNKNGTYEYGIKYFNKNFERLVKIKTAVDPKNFFINEQSIPIKSLLKKGET